MTISQATSSNATFAVGEKVEADYCLEGTYYPGEVVEVKESGSMFVVRSEDDGSEETLSIEHTVYTDCIFNRKLLQKDKIDDFQIAKHWVGKTVMKNVYEDYLLQAKLAEMKMERVT